jgi:hypothetical protein
MNRKSGGRLHVILSISTPEFKGEKESETNQVEGTRAGMGSRGTEGQISGPLEDRTGLKKY